MVHWAGNREGKDSNLGESRHKQESNKPQNLENETCIFKTDKTTYHNKSITVKINVTKTNIRTHCLIGSNR